MLVQKVLEPPPIKLTITLIHFVFVLTFFLILVFHSHLKRLVFACDC